MQNRKSGAVSSSFRQALAVVGLAAATGATGCVAQTRSAPINNGDGTTTQTICQKEIISLNEDSDGQWHCEDITYATPRRTTVIIVQPAERVCYRHRRHVDCYYP